MLLQRLEVQIEEIRARREAIGEHGCGEFSIKRSARAFMGAIRAAMVEDE